MVEAFIRGGAVQVSRPFHQKREMEYRIEEPPLPVDTPVGGRISLTYQSLAQITLDRWVLEIVKKGHLIEFLELPKVKGRIETPLGGGQKADVLLKEVQLLMEKNL